MRKKHLRTLESIFSNPVSGSIAWVDVEAMLLAYRAEIKEGRGSRVRILLNGEEAVFHRPHPRKETNKGAVVSLRRFLENAGVKPC